MKKINLTEAFADIKEFWHPKIAGDINNFQIKLAKLHGAFEWHFHEQEDELFLVINGQLRMHFRDHSEDLSPGEFIIIPRTVEHMPEALTEICEIVLFEPANTLNTGNVISERTRNKLERL